MGSRNKTILSKKYKIASAFVLVLGLAIIGISKPVWSRDFALATTKRPQPFTELYFNNLRTLPTETSAGKPVNLSFTIANFEETTKNYQYRVKVTKQGVTKITARTVVLQPNRTVALPVTFETGSVGEIIDIAVELPEQNQTIHLRSKS